MPARGGFTTSPDPRYKFLRQLGSGTYGCVAAVRDLDQGVDVAMKKISELRDFTVCRRTLREIKLMRHFRHRNLLHLEGVLALDRDARTIYVVTPLMDCDLHTLLHKRSSSLTASHVRGFLSQMLLGLLHLHSGHVIHRDLKPANIFVRKDGLLKIGDLGLSRGIDLEDDSLEPLRQPDEKLTEYVVTRWWRAPEVFLTPSQYGPPVDVWSIGCILSEMITGTALFPGKNSFDQLKRIVAILGSPSGDYAGLLQQGSGGKMMRQVPTCSPKLEKLRENWRIPASEQLSDLLEQMVALDPDERITLEQALAHPVIEHLYSPAAVADAKNIAVFNQDYDKEYDGLSHRAQQGAVAEVAERLYHEVGRIRGLAAAGSQRRASSSTTPRGGPEPAECMSTKNNGAGAGAPSACSSTAASTSSSSGLPRRRLEEEGVYEFTPDFNVTSQAEDRGIDERHHRRPSWTDCQQDDQVRDQERERQRHQEDLARERFRSGKDSSITSTRCKEDPVRAAADGPHRRLSTGSTELPRRRLERDASAPAVALRAPVSARTRGSEKLAAGVAGATAARRTFKPPARTPAEGSRGSLARTLPGELSARLSQHSHSQREPLRRTSLSQAQAAQAAHRSKDGLWLTDEVTDHVPPRRTTSEVRVRRASDPDVISKRPSKPDLAGAVARRRWGSTAFH